MTSEEFNTDSQEFIITEDNLEKENSTSASNEISDLELIHFIGNKNTEYYFEKFKANETKKNFASWNWASFFLGTYWLLYRKLYKWFIGVLLVKLFGTLLISTFSSTLATIFDLAIMILLGVYGNCIYVYSSKKKISSLKSFFTKFGNSTEAIKENGGTNLVAPLVLLAIGSIIAMIFVSIFASVFSSIFMNYPMGLGF